jgi:hypothetical protein
VKDSDFAGIVAFYSIVHIPLEDLPRALLELRRVLRRNGPLLLAFHVGEGIVNPGELSGVPIPLDGFFFRTEELTLHLRAAGFSLTEVFERGPYEGIEHPSQRAYVLAR